MYNDLLYLVYWGMNVLVLYGLGWVFPRSVVLGVNKFGPLEAAVYGGFWMTFVVWTVGDFAVARGFRFGRGSAWMYFGVANMLAVLVVSRFGWVTGVNVLGVGWMMGVALVANLLQRMVWGRVASRKG